MKKLAIIITHPIQYYAPLFRLLAKQCKLKVFYTWGKDGIQPKHDPDFGRVIDWDIPLLEGYEYELVENIAKNPGSHHGKGIINPNIINTVKDFTPDAILVYGYIYHSHLQIIRYFKGKTPVWFRGDSTLLDGQGTLKAMVKMVYLKWIYHHVDKAFYVGENNKKYFKKYGLKEKQLVFTPHTIDNDRFTQDRTIEAEHLRKKLGLKKNDILILFAGKLESKKNPELLLEAFLELNKEETATGKILDKAQLHLLFVGNGDLETKLKAESTKQSKIHFLNFQNQTQMPVVYQACDIFCLPSQGPGETWGLAVNEAMAAGKAIIVSNKVGCAVDLVKNGINGYIFKSNNMEDLKEKLLLLTNQPNLITNFGDQSRNIIKNWRFEHQAESLITNLNAAN